MAFIKGDEIDPDGFDIVATISYAEEDGEVLVVHNNSSHLHVIVNPTKNGDKYFLYEASFPYYANEGDYAKAYKYALQMACDIAVKR